MALTKEKMMLIVRRKVANVYGDYYFEPINKEAKDVCNILKNKAFNSKQLYAIELLGKKVRIKNA